MPNSRRRSGVVLAPLHVLSTLLEFQPGHVAEEVQIFGEAMWGWVPEYTMWRQVTESMAWGNVDGYLNTWQCYTCGHQPLHNNVTMLFVA